MFFRLLESVLLQLLVLTRGTFWPILMPRNTSKPTFVLMAGMPGAGKSTLALALGRELGWPVLDKDTIKVALLEEKVPESIAGPASYYVPLAICRDLVAQQQLSVIFDSPAAYPNVVEQAQKIADTAGGLLKVIFCHADSKVRKQRLSKRPRRLSQMQTDPSTDEENLRRFAHLPPLTLRMEMERPLSELVTKALAYIDSKTEKEQGTPA